MPDTPRDPAPPSLVEAVDDAITTLVVWWNDNAHRLTRGDSALIDLTDRLRAALAASPPPPAREFVGTVPRPPGFVGKVIATGPACDGTERDDTLPPAPPEVSAEALDSAADAMLGDAVEWVDAAGHDAWSYSRTLHDHPLNAKQGRYARALLAAAAQLAEGGSE